MSHLELTTLPLLIQFSQIPPDPTHARLPRQILQLQHLAKAVPIPEWREAFFPLQSPVVNAIAASFIMPFSPDPLEGRQVADYFRALLQFPVAVLNSLSGQTAVILASLAVRELEEGQVLPEAVAVLEKCEMGLVGEGGVQRGVERERVLRPLHVAVVKACLTLQQYTAALPFITPAKTSFSDISYKDNLQFHFQAGVIQCALLNWRQAEINFELVVSAPGKEVSAFQLEALKWLVFVQLILHDAAKPIAPHANGNLSKLTKDVMRPFASFAAAYVEDSQDLSAAMDMINKMEDQLATSKILSLAQYTLSLLPQRRVQRLAAIYDTIAIKDVRKAANLPARFSDDEILKLVPEHDPTISLSGTGAGSILHFNASQSVDLAILSSSIAQVQKLLRASELVNSQITQSTKWQSLEAEETNRGNALPQGGANQLGADLKMKSYNDNY